MSYESLKEILDILQCSILNDFNIDFVCSDGCHRQLSLQTSYNPKFKEIEVKND